MTRFYDSPGRCSLVVVHLSPGFISVATIFEYRKRKRSNYSPLDSLFYRTHVLRDSVDNEIVRVQGSHAPYSVQSTDRINFPPEELVPGRVSVSCLFCFPRKLKGPSTVTMHAYNASGFVTVGVLGY